MRPPMPEYSEGLRVRLTHRWREMDSNFQYASAVRWHRATALPLPHTVKRRSAGRPPPMTRPRSGAQRGSVRPAATTRPAATAPSATAKSLPLDRRIDSRSWVNSPSPTAISESRPDHPSPLRLVPLPVLGLGCSSPAQHLNREAATGHEPVWRPVTRAGSGGGLAGDEGGGPQLRFD